jgi:hypothetical protein
MNAQIAFVFPARRTDPDTSKAAAASVKISQLEDLVLEELFKHAGGLTTRQIAANLKRDLVSISPRMKPLTIKRAIKDSGLRVRGAAGRMQIVWTAVV